MLTLKILIISNKDLSESFAGQPVVELQLNQEFDPSNVVFIFVSFIFDFHFKQDYNNCLQGSHGFYNV